MPGVPGGPPFTARQRRSQNVERATPQGRLGPSLSLGFAVRAHLAASSPDHCASGRTEAKRLLDSSCRFDSNPGSHKNKNLPVGACYPPRYPHRVRRAADPARRSSDQHGHAERRQGKALPTARSPCGVFTGPSAIRSSAPTRSSSRPVRWLAAYPFEPQVAARNGPDHTELGAVRPAQGPRAP